MTTVAPPGDAQAEASAASPARPATATGEFVDCYRAHYGRLVRALQLAGADPLTAEDVTQEAFARTLVHWRRVRRGTNPPGYVYRTAFRLLNRHQSRSRATTTTSSEYAGSSANAMADSVAAGNVTASNVTAGNVSASNVTAGPEGEATTRVSISRALLAMPPRRRQCAVLCLIVGLPVSETAAALGIAEGTVRKHLEEARADLRTAGDPSSG